MGSNVCILEDASEQLSLELINFGRMDAVPSRSNLGHNLSLRMCILVLNWLTQLKLVSPYLRNCVLVLLTTCSLPAGESSVVGFRVQLGCRLLGLCALLITAVSNFMYFLPWFVCWLSFSSTNTKKVVEALRQWINFFWRSFTRLSFQIGQKWDNYF